MLILAVFVDGAPERFEVGVLPEDEVREMIVTIINMLAPGNPEFAQQDRRGLSGMLSQ